MAISRSCMAAFIRRRMPQTPNAFLDFSPRSDPMVHVGYATNVSIEEINDPATGHPRSITA